MAKLKGLTECDGQLGQMVRGYQGNPWYKHDLIMMRMMKNCYNCYYCLLKIIITYLKPYNCVQTNDHYLIEIDAWNHTSVYRLLLCDREQMKPCSYLN